ncbi:MAG: type II toxin-antitoxin system HicB family antitoxin [Acidobacteriota bacterium]
MAREFTVLVEAGDDGYLVGSVPELPGCFSQGKDLGELLERMKEAIELVLEHMGEEGIPVEPRAVSLHKVAV